MIASRAVACADPFSKKEVALERTATTVSHWKSYNQMLNFIVRRDHAFPVAGRAGLNKMGDLRWSHGIWVAQATG
jgi:hypothetical protein